MSTKKRLTRWNKKYTIFKLWYTCNVHASRVHYTWCVRYHLDGNLKKKIKFPFLPLFNFFLILFMASNNVDESFSKQIAWVMSRDFPKFEGMKLKIQVVLTGLVSPTLYRSTLSSWVISLNVMCCSKSPDHYRLYTLSTLGHWITLLWENTIERFLYWMEYWYKIWYAINKHQIDKLNLIDFQLSIKYRYFFL